MISLKQNLLRTLSSTPARWVNFMHQNRGIAPITFHRLAVHIHDGSVSTKIDPNIQGRMAFYDPNNNTIIASDHDFGSSYFDEKAVLIHEATHAILDRIYKGKTIKGRRAPMRVVDDEMMGYLAGAFYLVAANATGPSRVGPEREALKIAKRKLNPRQRWDGCQTFRFTAQELQPLRSAVASSPLYRKDAHTIALHDG